MNEKITLELNDGKEIELSLSFQRLAFLKKVRNDLYQRYNSIMMNNKKEMDFFDMPFIIYIAYWCANYRIGEDIYSEEDFISLIPFDFKTIKRIFNQLTSPKKKINSEKSL